MFDLKLIFFSIFFSMLFHLLLISNFDILKKKDEIYVVNLSEFQEFKLVQPNIKPQSLVEKKIIDPPKKIIKPKIKTLKPKIKEIYKKETLPIKKIDSENFKNKVEKKEEIKEKKIIKKSIEKKENIEKNQIFKSSSSQKKNSDKVKKILSDYLTNISLEINKVALKSYPQQSIRRREQGTIISILILDKKGQLIDLRFENKSPKRLYNATKAIFSSFTFPIPPKEILDSNGNLQIKIPVNFVLK